jgi:hypothetical protein
MMKTMQVSKNEVFLLGGTDQKVHDSYNQCLVYNTKTYEVTDLPCMNDARMNFGTIIFDNFIYCVGGAGSNRTLLSTCERMNLNIRDKWEELPELNETRFSSSLIVMD